MGNTFVYVCVCLRGKLYKPTEQKQTDRSGTRCKMMPLSCRLDVKYFPSHEPAQLAKYK